ncbi:UDP-galactopyranose mutase [Vibrio cholerae]|nr:putative mutase [Vibrio cholerae]GHW45188.1 UDP-galactopyranose mutase [Vibrio cholerae]
MDKVLIIGAGLTGATLARKFAESNLLVEVVEARSHIAGNCYDELDSKTNVMVHKYGPHIFHTNNKDVWRFINRFGEFVPYKLQVKTKVSGEVYSLPLNLHTINQFYRKTFSPKQAKQYISELTSVYQDLNEESFRDIGLKSAGKDIYESFFKCYAEKQWGVSDNLIPAGVLKRLPIRFNYDDNYFNHCYQGIPKNGYTAVIEKMLQHKNINVKVNKKVTIQDLRNSLDSGEFIHVVFTGPVDELYDYQHGELPYRTLSFEAKYCDDDDLGCAVMAHPSKEYKFTRITDHKYFMPWRLDETNGTIQYYEYSRNAERKDEKYYPIRLTSGNEVWSKYQKIIDKEIGISFIGRLAEFKYMDMDVCVLSALNKFENIINIIRNKHEINRS